MGLGTDHCFGTSPGDRPALRHVQKEPAQALDRFCLVDPDELAFTLHRSHQCTKGQSGVHGARGSSLVAYAVREPSGCALPGKRAAIVPTRGTNDHRVAPGYRPSSPPLPGTVAHHEEPSGEGSNPLPMRLCNSFHRSPQNQNAPARARSAISSGFLNTFSLRTHSYAQGETQCRPTETLSRPMETRA
jgi:hypothetical protein